MFFVVHSQVLSGHYREKCPCPVWGALCVFPWSFVAKKGNPLAWEKFLFLQSPLLKPLYKTSICGCPISLLPHPAELDPLQLAGVPWDQCSSETWGVVQLPGFYWHGDKA